MISGLMLDILQVIITDGCSHFVYDMFHYVIKKLFDFLHFIKKSGGMIFGVNGWVGGLMLYTE